MTVNEIYQSGLKLLENSNIENSKFEAQSLLQKAFSLDRVGFIIHKTDKADENCSHNFLNFIEKRISGEPLQLSTANHPDGQHDTAFPHYRREP